VVEGADHEVADDPDRPQRALALGGGQKAHLAALPYVGGLRPLGGIIRPGRPGSWRRRPGPGRRGPAAR
jgi:hypothetical protein